MSTVLETRNEKMKGLDREEAELIKELYIPTNDNMRNDLFENVRSLYGRYIERAITKMFKRKEYRVPISQIRGDDAIKTRIGKDAMKLKIAAAEDIPGFIIDDADEGKRGITGSDFVIEALYERGIRIDPRSIFPDHVDSFQTYKFDRDGKLVPNSYDAGIDGKIVEIRILEQRTNPRMCILGADDKTLEEIIRERTEQNEKVRVVYEKRFNNIATALLENLGFPYKPLIVTRKAEMYIIRPLPDGTRDGEADIGIEIGESFNTARSNRLKSYTEIFNTYPVEIRCYRAS